MKHTSKCFLMVWVWGCMAAPLAAQQVYTLDECIESALLNNARMKNAANDLASARHERKEAFTNYFPSISATGGGFLSSTHLLGMEMGPGMSLGLMKDGLLGMEMGPGMSLGLMKDGLVGGVTASMPLFTGGQIVQGNKLSEVNVEKYRLLGRQAENEVKLTAEQYYWQVAMLKEKLRTLHVVEAQLAEILKDVDAAVQAGVTNRNDLLQVQLRQNDTRSTRINVENSLALSRCLLAQYIGTPGDSVDVDFAVADSLPEPPDALYRRPDESLALTPEYNLLQAKLKASRIERKMTLGKQLPTVAIGGGFVYDNLLDRDRNYWVGFATVSVPLSGWWEGSHSLKRSKLAVRTEENNLRNGSELLVINMQNTWNAVTDAYKQVRIAIESIGQSAENLRLQTDYYHAGTCVKKREYLQSTGR